MTGRIEGDMTFRTHSRRIHVFTTVALLGILNHLTSACSSAMCIGFYVPRM